MAVTLKFRRQSKYELGAPNKMWRLMFLRSLFAIIALVIGTVAIAVDDSAKVAAAEPIVSAWARLLDAGRYEDCWDSLSTSAKATMPKDQWFIYMNGVRKSMGALKSRKLTKSVYVPSLKNLPAQDGVIFTYESDFENKAGVRETFGVIHDKDDQWRVGHYLTN